ncbi:hypothetical protein V8C42DRAFT_342929 [Trichoderma barbatum]
MKSFLLAATAVTAVAGRSLLELGLDIDLSKTVDLGAGVSLHLPQGIDAPAAAEHKPSGAPPPGRINIWHPAHAGILMDGCNAETDDDWHWVHPCGDDCRPEQAEHVWTVSTVSVTSIHTVISCAPTVTNCPANGYHTSTIVIPETTTICPVEASRTKTADHPAGPTDAYPPAASSPAHSAPVPTNTAVVTMSTHTLPAPTGPAGYPAPSGSAPAHSAPPAVPSGPASPPNPAYPVPGNSSAPAHTAPSTSIYSPPTQSSPAGCKGDNCSPSAPPTYSAPSGPADGCSGAYCAPPAGTAPGTAPPAPTGNSTAPPPVNDAVGRAEGVSMALFAGVIAALFL